MNGGFFWVSLAEEYSVLERNDQGHQADG